LKDIRTYLVHMEAIGPYAKTHGAIFDEDRQLWYVDGEVPTELWGLLPKSLNKPPPKNQSPSCPLCGASMRIQYGKKYKNYYWSCDKRFLNNCSGNLQHSGIPHKNDSPTEILSILNKQFFPNQEYKKNLPRCLDDCAQMSLHEKRLAITLLFKGDRDQSNLARWLTRAQPTLSGETPAILLLTDEGCCKLLRYIFN
jgi:hypothetical protein